MVFLFPRKWIVPIWNVDNLEMLDMVNVIFLISNSGCLSSRCVSCSPSLDINQTVAIISTPITWIKSFQNNKLFNEKGCRVRQWSIFSTDKLEDDTSEAWINTWGTLLYRKLKIKILVLLKKTMEGQVKTNTKQQMWATKQENPSILDRTKILIYHVISTELY